MTVLDAVLAGSPAAVAWLLLRAHAKEAEHWGVERRELLNRIQRPEHIPIPPTEAFEFPELEPDEINDVNTIKYEPEVS